MTGRACQIPENKDMTWETCSLGHLNSYQCRSWWDHYKFLKDYTDEQLENSILNEKEKAYVRNNR